MSKTMAVMTLCALLATPAIALGATAHRTQAHRAYAQSPNASGDSQMSAERTRAIEECTAEEQKYNDVSWGHIEMDIYRTCMANHHQAE